MNEPQKEQVPQAPLPVEPGHVMSWEKFKELHGEQQQ